ncbi:MAG TPA: hypothetical protein VHZ73_13955 [Vicinamibacterales bacterium]|jgi:hypothetical protein|nr:hypothetical protein [Vicinamibacterales bacterium]
MIFHERVRNVVEVSVPRLAIALTFCALLIGGALTAHAMNYPAGADALLHLTETVVGAMVGAFVGERGAAHA